MRSTFALFLLSSAIAYLLTPRGLCCWQWDKTISVPVSGFDDQGQRPEWATILPGGTDLYEKKVGTLPRGIIMYANGPGARRSDDFTMVDIIGVPMPNYLGLRYDSRTAYQKQELTKLDPLPYFPLALRRSLLTDASRSLLEGSLNIDKVFDEMDTNIIPTMQKLLQSTPTFAKWTLKQQEAFCDRAFRVKHAVFLVESGQTEWLLVLPGNRCGDRTRGRGSLAVFVDPNDQSRLAFRFDGALQHSLS